LRPPGLLAGVVALTPSAATGKGDAMVEDLTALAANVSVIAVESACVPLR
jgi:hypothetical protein